MNQEKNLMVLKVALMIFAIIAVVYGLGHVFFPDALVEMSGSDPIEPGWLRWPGGVLIALGIGTIMAFRNPSKQDIFIITIALGTLFTGLALLYTLIFEIQAEQPTWFTAFPAIINLVLSALLWWGRQQAKEILKQE